MQNLRDKLMKAGLVSKEQSEAADAETARKKEEAKRTRDQRPAHASRPPPRSSPAPQHARAPVSERPIPKLPPLALPGSKAHQRLEAIKQMELHKRIRELVKTNEVLPDDGTVRFHFMTRKGKLRRLDISDAQQKQLEEGKLAIVERPEPALIEHSIVPREIAEQLLAFSEKTVRFYNRDGKPIGFLSDEELNADASAEPETNTEGQQAEATATSPKSEEEVAAEEGSGAEGEPPPVAEGESGVPSEAEKQNA